MFEELENISEEGTEEWWDSLVEEMPKWSHEKRMAFLEVFMNIISRSEYSEERIEFLNLIEEEILRK